MKCICSSAKIGTNDPKAIISAKLMKFALSYATTLKGGKWLLRKSEIME